MLISTRKCRKNHCNVSELTKVIYNIWPQGLRVCSPVPRFEEPLAHMLTECRRTVLEQLDALQQRREQHSQPQYNAPGTAMILLPPPCTLMVTPTQKQQLQQQVQQVSKENLVLGLQERTCRITAHTFLSYLVTTVLHHYYLTLQMVLSEDSSCFDLI